jgi:tRNA G18 (ribose-2'-O)-methylase SpoU
VRHRPVTIPNLGGTAESLNAAVACAILMAQMLQKP